MEYINHITLNTGQVRKSYANEIDKGLYFTLNRVLKEAITSEGATLFEKYTVKTTKVGPSAITTVYGPESMPILTTACSKNDDGSLWRMLHDTYAGPLATNANSPVPSPYVADRIEVGAMKHMDALVWTGDFARCVAWAALYPNKIR